MVGQTISQYEILEKPPTTSREDSPPSGQVGEGGPAWGCPKSHSESRCFPSGTKNLNQESRFFTPLRSVQNDVCFFRLSPAGAKLKS
jgi:hypothetical protein